MAKASAEVEDGETHTDETITWHLAVLFGALVILTVVFERGMNAINTLLHKKRMKSLKHTFHKLQEELMLLGIISFLLVATEEPFVNACIISTGGSGCSPTEAFFTYNAVHQIHLFLFVLSATHIIYSALSLVLCVISLKKWERLEDQPVRLRRLHGRRFELAIQEIRGAGLRQYWRAFTTQFIHSMTADIYYELRSIFVERTGVPASFNFARFVTVSLEEDFSTVVKLDWIMVIMTTAIICSSDQLHLQLWMPIFFLVMTVVVGTKLEWCALQMACYRGKDQKAVSNASTNELYEESVDSEDSVKNGGAESSKTRRELKGKRSEDVQLETGSLDEGTSSLPPLDAASLFWFRKPRLVLKMFQYLLFQNSLSISLAIYNFWQGSHSILQNRLLDPSYVFIALAVDLLVMVHSSMLMLPVYALTSSVGSHCSGSIQKYVRKNSHNPKKAEMAFKLETQQTGTVDPTSNELHWDRKTMSLKPIPTESAIGDEDNSLPNGDKTDGENKEEKEPGPMLDQIKTKMNPGLQMISKATKKISKASLKAAKRQVTFSLDRPVNPHHEDDDHKRDSESSMDMLLRGVYSQQLLQRLALASKNTAIGKETSDMLESIPESQGSPRFTKSDSRISEQFMQHLQLGTAEGDLNASDHVHHREAMRCDSAHLEKWYEEDAENEERLLQSRSDANDAAVEIPDATSPPTIQRTPNIESRFTVVEMDEQSGSESGSEDSSVSSAGSKGSISRAASAPASADSRPTIMELFSLSGGSIRRSADESTDANIARAASEPLSASADSRPTVKKLFAHSGSIKRVSEEGSVSASRDANTAKAASVPSADSRPTIMELFSGSIKRASEDIKRASEDSSVSVAGRRVSLTKAATVPSADSRPTVMELFGQSTPE